ncbi:MAG TPA: class F sortase [Pseudonocardia sp.]|nr:class F sortase [Pseudonocardia sp.]
MSPTRTSVQPAAGHRADPVDGPCADPGGAGPARRHRHRHRHRHRRVVPVRTRETWLLGAVALGACLLLACCSGGAATPVPPVGPPPAAPVQVTSTLALAAATPVRIRIPAIGVDSALIAVGLAADGTLQVPVDGSVAGWFTGSPTPGEHGPAVIAAHVDWNHAPGVFFHLRDLEPGAEVAVDRRDGTTARFAVLEVEQYPKDAFPTERVYGDIDHAGLRLITCGGSFDRAARSYRDNVVVYAGLVGSSAATRA